MGYGECIVVDFLGGALGFHCVAKKKRRSFGKALTLVWNFIGYLTRQTIGLALKAFE